MKFKYGVKVKGIKPELLIALVVADTCWKRYGDELVVTSLTDSKHGNGSLHPSGYGGDLRTRNFPKNMVEAVAQDLRERLTDEYDVVVESDHIHIEFDPK